MTGNRCNETLQRQSCQVAYTVSYSFQLLLPSFFCIIIDKYDEIRKRLDERSENQMRDETAKDNRQTAEWINHDLTRNSGLTFSFTRNL